MKYKDIDLLISFLFIKNAYKYDVQVFKKKPTIKRKDNLIGLCGFYKTCSVVTEYDIFCLEKYME